MVREFNEELGVALAEPEHIETFEQVFTHDGNTGHEVWRVYEAHIVEEWPYTRDSFTFIEPDLDTEHLARWMSVDSLRDDDTTFYSLDVLDALGV